MHKKQEIDAKYEMAKRCLSKADEYLINIDPTNEQEARDILDFTKEMQKMADALIEKARVMIEENKEIKSEKK